jgi:type III pantothenate kinase
LILCVDVGNTATKIAVVRGARVVRRALVLAQANERELARACVRVVRGTRSLQAAVVSSVRPRATETVVHVIVRTTGLYPTVVNHRTPMPIDVAVRYPARLGTDRLCAACGAIDARRRDAIVVTVGSAITVNLVVDRVFLGGVIMPGPAASLTAMHASTAQLPKLDLDARTPKRINDTESAMRWGALLSSAGGVQLAVELLDRWAGRRPARVITGGDAPRVTPWLPRSWKHLPDLTLVGMARIARLTR